MTTAMVEAGAQAPRATQMTLPTLDVWARDVLAAGSRFDLDAWARNLLAAQPRGAAPVQPGGYEVTWADYYCGAGGSTGGLHELAGVKVVMAANHWALAVATHQHNFPDTDHDTADITGIDPRRHPTTDFAWFSPECTKWSVAQGKKCDYDGVGGTPLDGYLDVAHTLDGDDPEKPESAEATRRSRVQMIDVVRFSAHHRYKGVIVENVPDILKWANLDRWLGDMHALGYKHKIITLNSAFAQALGDPAPQLRDRVYVVFWQARYRTPDWDKWLRPHGWCPTCEQVVRSVYTAKPGPRRAMRYGAQYFYRCPRMCGVDGKVTKVQPFIRPALAAIDLSLPTQRIGGRKRPIKPKTRTRVGAAVIRHVNRRADPQVPMLVPAGGTWNDTASDGEQPMRARTTRENEAVLQVARPGYRPGQAYTGQAYTGQAYTVSTSGREGSGRARDVTATLATQTARHEAALLQVPGAHQDVPLYVPLRNNGVGRPADETPTMTFAAGGQHHAVVMRNNTARGDQGQMSTSLAEPMRTLLATGKQSVIEWGQTEWGQIEWGQRAGIYSYDTGLMRPLGESPLPTQTTVDGDALLCPDGNAGGSSGAGGGGLDAIIDACWLRMLAVTEVQEGMNFRRDFKLLGDAKRDKIKMLGNAVTRCSSRDLAACLMERILGRDYTLAEYALAA